MGSANSWTIRDADKKEAAVLLDFWLQAGATPGVPDTLEDVERMLATGTALIAVANDRVVGSIFGVFDGWRANIYRLAVHPAFRRHGIARALVAEVEARLVRQGARRFSAIVEVDHPWAMSFWRAMGYAAQATTVRHIRNISGPVSHEVVPTRTGYDRWAEVYDGDDNPLVLLEEEHVKRLLGDVAGLAVADMGCGTGRHALRLAIAGARVTAVDFSEVMLARAHAKQGAEAITFLHHDLAEPLSLPAATFDRIVCGLVAEHIADLESLFREWRRVCKPDGVAVISVMHPALNLRGVEPRFIDPGTGGRVSPRSYPHQVADYVMAALRTGWTIDHLSEHRVDSALAERSPRGRKYLGWPLLLLLRMRNSTSAPQC